MIKFIYVEVMWLVHNVVAHPVSGVLMLFRWIPGVDKLANWVHEVSAPAEDI